MNRSTIYPMYIAVSVSALLMVAKFIAFWITGSNAILSDALESIVNVVATSFALFSVYFAAQPKDRSHPYGHGKIEFFSAGLEGTLIVTAGCFIILKAIYDFFYPSPLKSMELGIIITALAGLTNGLLGYYLIRKGRQLNSVTLKADGKHLLSDTYTSIGLLLGLGWLYWTQWYWIDNLLALIFGGIITYMGYNLIRDSIAALLDEADHQVLQQIIDVLQKHRRDFWIDLHNMRVQKFGHALHVDCHVTFPWYAQLDKVHHEVEVLERLANRQMSREIEFFIHADPCKPSLCPICAIKDCPVRQHPFQQQIKWTLNNVMSEQHHNIDSPAS